MQKISLNDAGLSGSDLCNPSHASALQKLVLKSSIIRYNSTNASSVNINNAVAFSNTIEDKLTIIDEKKNVKKL